MEKKHALYLAVCAATIGFCLGLVYPGFFPTAVLWYHPLEHRWTFELTPRGLAMDWYGRNLLAAAAWLASGAAGYFIARRAKPPKAESLRVWAGWAGSAALFAASFYAYQLAMRRPVPEPLPAWYAPR